MSLSHEELIGEIRGIFAENWSIRVESATTDLLDTGLVDSVTLVELLLELERRFGVSLPFENLEIEDFRTLERTARMVMRLRGESATTAGSSSGESTVPPSNAAA